ncbi:thioredoxin family protein [uncultured Zoogloea sp.]|uniref:thioredoxin family protein n=1 Tax=uncultured Zoogloea sp. TaxID=160237 RepID=UPI00260B1ADA|nr:thioredoxin family protein [uncultured Zoogloea sp.]
MNRLTRIPRVVTALACLLAPIAAQALEIQPYSADALAAAQSAGKPVAVHFHAPWCPTCRAQAKVFDGLKPDASLPLPLLVADYDSERALRQKLGVRTQSTLIVWRGAKETARLAGETDADRLRAALRSAVSPAQ